jgi:TRAP-type C4-dicarboxylate transport system permease small subunit
LADNSPDFIIAVIFVALMGFLAWMGYKILVPVWGMTAGAVAAVYPTMVGNDPTYVGAFNTIASELNIEVNYGFVVIAMGALFFMLVFVYRRHYTDVGGIGEPEF